jgi:5-methylcytosine-specific restriction protein A
MWLFDFFKKLSYERIVGQKPPAQPRDGRWHKLRCDFLLKFPYCAICLSKKNLTVHHIKPFHLFPELELEWSNLLNVCENPGLNCHLYFCHWGNWKDFNSQIVADVPTIQKLLGKGK